MSRDLDRNRSQHSDESTLSTASLSQGTNESEEEFSEEYESEDEENEKEEEEEDEERGCIRRRDKRGEEGAGGADDEFSDVEHNSEGEDCFRDAREGKEEEDGDEPSLTSSSSLLEEESVCDCAHCSAFINPPRRTPYKPWRIKVSTTTLCVLLSMSLLCPLKGKA